ncbi:MAG: type I methionyl aminopeptidase [Clostridia bacterium]
MSIVIKTDKELELIRIAGKITGDVLKVLEKEIYVGQTTNRLNEIAIQYIRSQGAEPSCLGYEGFPYAICASKNDAVVHGFCDDEPLKDGDIISIDVCVNYKGYNGDAARTFAVGNISPEAKKLIDVTKQAFFVGIEDIKEGSKLGHISARIQQYVEAQGLSIVREMAGHGVGKDLHEDPIIPNYGRYNAGPVLKSGMVLAVEPMVNMGERYVYLDENGWTIRTRDGKYAAHYENTIIICQNGVEIITN